MTISFDKINRAGQGRWIEIFSAAGIPPDLLDGFSHPCPKCGGVDRFAAQKSVNGLGKVFCRGCFNKDTPIKPGDGIATVAWFTNRTNGDAAKWVANYLGIDANKQPTTIDLIAEICREKRMPIDAFRQFNPTIEKRGRSRSEVVRVPVFNERGEKHSYFDFAVGHKGWFARGKGMAGMFFPGRLPKPGETWLIVEGCKDAAALIGLGFNACGLPTSTMADKYARLFAGCHIIIVPDLDTAGQSGAQLTGGRLIGVVASVRVARLPGEIVESHGDDVRDVLKRPDGERLIRDAIENATPWTPRAGELDARDGRPEVLLTLAYGHCVDQVTEHLGRLGWQSDWIPEPKRERLKLYQRGGLLVHVVTEDTDTAMAGGVDVPAGTVRIRPLPAGQLPLRIADACQLIVETETSEGIERKAAPPPKWLVDGVYSRGEYGGDVRKLEGVITAPTLRVDGTILQTAGYDKRTGLLYSPNDKFPTVADKPSRSDAKAAAVQLLEVVKDFPFVADADSSAWLALVLSQIGRVAISGCVPLFGITSTCRGSGKGLGVDAASLIAFGRPAARKPYSTDDDEQRKAITATAIEALPAVLLDNVDKTLQGSALDAAITATTWSDRVLGSSKTTGEIPLRTVWAATGNNLRFGSDLARRVLPIRLAPSVENPEDRDDFAHADLLGWVRENRPRLAVAALTILRAYFVAGRPVQSGGTWGSFESWSALVRGAIVWTGLADPLTTRETAKADDQSGAIVRGLIGGLLEVDDSGDGMTAREIADALNDSKNAERFPTLRDVVAEVATVRGIVDGKKLSYSLRRYRGRIANGFKIDGESGHGGVIRWMANRVSGGDGGHGGDATGVPYVRDVCVSHIDTHDATHTRDTHATHTYSDGTAGESCQSSPPSPPDKCQHVWRDSTEADGITRRFCSLPTCYKFAGFVLADGSLTDDVTRARAEPATTAATEAVDDGFG